MNIVRIIDTETTGLDPDVDRICEIAKVDWIDGELAAPATDLINPGIPMPAMASAVHHLTDKHLVGKPEAFEAMGAYSGAEIAAAHNADFDRKFLPPEFAKHWVCTYKVSLRLWPDLPSHSNQFLRYHLGLEDPPELAGYPHRALYDAFVTAKLFIEELKLMTVKEMVAISREPGLLKMVNFGKYYGKGKTFAEIATSDEKYLRWVAEESTLSDDIKFSARRALERTT